MTLNIEGRIGVRTGRMGGQQFIYDLGNGYGLSAVNSPDLHSFPFAWEFAVVSNPTATGFDDLDYSTPLTQDVEVFSSDEEANEFIAKAFAWAKGGAA